MEANRKAMGSEDIDRVEGRAKVRGAAKYGAEYVVPGMQYGVLVNRTITRGRILLLNTAEAAAGGF